MNNMPNISIKNDTQEIENVEIIAEKRSSNNKKSFLKKKRLEGTIPGVMYRDGENILFFVQESSIKNVAFSDEPKLIILKFGEVEHKCIIKEIQTNKINGRIIHVDLYKIDPQEELCMNVLVEHVGVPIGVKQGGVLLQKTKILKVKSLIKNLPKKIYVDISNLKDGETYRIEDVVKEKEFKILNELKTPIFSIKAIKNKC